MAVDWDQRKSGADFHAVRLSRRPQQRADQPDNRRRAEPDVNYSYDSLNRLSTAQATNGAWGQSYNYDGFGNLTAKTVTAGSAQQFNAAYNATTNQQASWPYDANGNLLYGTYAPSGRPFQYL